MRNEIGKTFGSEVEVWRSNLIRKIWAKSFEKSIWNSVFSIMISETNESYKIYYAFAIDGMISQLFHYMSF